MKQITISELKQLKVTELKAILPCEIKADGDVIAVLNVPGTPEEDTSHIKTKCPNCKMVYQVRKPDNEPIFLSMQHK
jgi:hypothetical protein